MTPADFVTRFKTLYLGDSLLQRVEFRIAEAECWLRFNAGKVLAAQGASIFEPAARFEPALLRLHGVRTVSCEGGRYQLNATVVDFGAEASADGEHVEFFLELTGGTDPEDFMVRLKFQARGFEFGPVEG